jgi:hypothetical protein
MTAAIVIVLLFEFAKLIFPITLLLRLEPHARRVFSGNGKNMGYRRQID